MIMKIATGRFLQFFKIVLIPIIFATVWVNAYPLETKLSFISEFFHLSLMMIHSSIILIVSIIFFRIAKIERPKYINFLNCYFLVVAMYTIFWLIYVPYGPNLGLLGVVRNFYLSVFF